MGSDAVSLIVLVAVLCVLSVDELVVAAHAYFSYCVPVLDLGDHQVSTRCQQGVFRST